ncbi:hypothetical protein [Halobacillus ihumii]|uniref:hypothetical protein n=1 Tax=Halobacillus ihumii TaxID=2686092 RepID=UPI0013D3E879|nr:hypothetical protein [Halobacillus ihumii]
MCDQPSSCHQPVYGSLYGLSSNFLTPVNHKPIEFVTAGPTSGMDADPVTNSITVNSPGIYEVEFSLTNSVSNSAGTFLRYSIVINENIQFIGSLYFSNSTTATNFYNGSKKMLLNLNSNDIITVVPNGIVGNNQYLNPELIVKKII